MRDFTEMKNIPGYEERYAATKDGRIWSYKRKKFLAPCADKYGYLTTLINNAGAVFDFRQKPSETKIDDIRKDLEVNFFGLIDHT